MDGTTVDVKDDIITIVFILMYHFYTFPRTHNKQRHPPLLISVILFSYLFYLFTALVSYRTGGLAS